MYKASIQKKLKGLLFPMLSSFLTSKEADMRYSGLIVLGSLCGMNYNFEQLGNSLLKHLPFFRRLSDVISLSIWESVFDMQVDAHYIFRSLEYIMLNPTPPFPF